MCGRGVGMAVRRDVTEAEQAAPRPLPRTEADPGTESAAEPEGPSTSAEAASDTAPGFAGASASATQVATGGTPRWLLVLAGAAAATIAVAGLRAVAWLVAPVFLALVVVIALAPVGSWLRRIGAPRWLATTVLLILVWAVLLSFVGLLILSVAELAALLPDYAGRAEVLTSEVVADLNHAGLVSGQLSDLIARIDYGQVVGLATGLLGRLTAAATTLLLLLSALVFMSIESSGFPRRIALVGAER